MRAPLERSRCLLKVMDVSTVVGMLDQEMQEGQKGLDVYNQYTDTIPQSSSVPFDCPQVTGARPAPGPYFTVLDWTLVAHRAFTALPVKTRAPA